MDNKMKLEFLSKSANESFARAAVSAFVSQLDPTLEELADIKTAVSEAVTNAIVHGYQNPDSIVFLSCEIHGQNVSIEIRDEGRGISDIALAMQPLYTGSPETERSGMGFTVMEAFMDSVFVDSAPGKGTKVILTKKIGKHSC
ncbi:MAG: anti-sigma F factor [Clostridia bacterium]|nr:anti-sigma F factor [Clostridia bacterium]